MHFTAISETLVRVSLLELTAEAAFAQFGKARRRKSCGSPTRMIDGDLVTDPFAPTGA
ncbi:hypothetical protein ThimaDRAFT_1736 [Thiocapsa marina 5811]|uniref:Uncharacterized protein n=2 Tax=Thiocapsa marina TaxID=244573 RepID=F9U9Y4_9GAMM|nr:hypothetical protein ThimaDRAFT_1736 [Thiocapsa marina 5811]